MKYSQSIQRLIDLFSKFPTVGPKTAARFVFYFLKLDKKQIAELLLTMKTVANNVKTCSFCFNKFESENKLCNICTDVSRDKSLLCVVSQEADLVAIENTNQYKGFYFILGGLLSIRKTDIKKLRSRELKERVSKNSFIKEIIIAMNPNTEGEATSIYTERILKPFNKKITRLGLGLPVGGELEYADKQTLKAAFEGRK
jgi:recombination protein RecR